MSKNPLFAEALMRPRTELMIRSIQEKVRYREHIGIEIKGATRSGKSSVGIALCKFISALTGIPFTLGHICPNEIIYLQRLKDPNLPNGSVFLIDEQSLSIEEVIITDVGNIRLKNIKEDQTVNVLSFNFKQNKLEFTTAKKVKNKEKPVYRIKTKSGKFVEATEDHTFFVEVNGKIIEKKLRDLKKGEKLVCI